MKKEIKKYGNSAVIVLDAETMRAYRYKIGDILLCHFSKIGARKKK